MKTLRENVEQASASREHTPADRHEANGCIFKIAKTAADADRALLLCDASRTSVAAAKLMLGHFLLMRFVPRNTLSTK